MERKTIDFKTHILRHTINVIYNVILVYRDESFINYITARPEIITLLLNISGATVRLSPILY